MPRPPHPAQNPRDHLGAGQDRGASAVEFALLVPIFVMLVIGGITGGLAVNHKLSLTQAAREGARYGSTLPIPPVPGQTEADWLNAVLQTTQQAAGSDLVPGQDNSTLCVAFIDGATGPNTMHLSMDTTGAVSGPTTGPCFTDTSAVRADQRVQIQIQRDLLLDAGIYRWPLHIQTQAVVHYERPAP